MFPPLKIPVFYGGDRTIKLQSLTEGAVAKATSFFNGVYSNRLDQAGLDSPPFDGVKPL